MWGKICWFQIILRISRMSKKEGLREMRNYEKNLLLHPQLPSGGFPVVLQQQQEPPGLFLCAGEAGGGGGAGEAGGLCAGEAAGGPCAGEAGGRLPLSSSSRQPGEKRFFSKVGPRSKWFCWLRCSRGWWTVVVGGFSGKGGGSREGGGRLLAVWEPSLARLDSWRREDPRRLLGGHSDPPTPIALNSTAGIKQEFKIPPNCPTHLSGCSWWQNPQTGRESKWFFLFVFLLEWESSTPKP